LKTLALLDSLPFGKHKGEVVGTVIEEDPSYIRWMMENTDLCWEHEVLEYLKENE